MSSFKVPSKCGDMACTDKSCADYSFKKPKSYSELLKDLQHVMTEHVEALKELESSKKTIKSLREVNTKLMDTIKEKDVEIVKIKDQGQVFIRTYTNMSIEMLKLEEKLAKYEGRVF